MTGQWFSPGTPVSSINKTNHHDITEILFKVALSTINRTKATRHGLSGTLFKTTWMGLGAGISDNFTF